MLQILKKLRTPKLALVLLAAALVATGCGKKSDEVVATYKGGEVTKDELTTFSNTTTFFYPQFAQAGESAEMQQYLLKQLVTLKVLSGRATDESRKEAETATKEQIKQMEDYFTSQGEGALKKQLDELKITQADVEIYMNRNIIVMTDMNKKVTDEQAKEAYDAKLKADPHAYDIASVAHILIGLKDPNDNTKDLRTKEEALKRANEVKAKLDAGGDFAALAKEYSDDPGSKDNGGKYENASPSSWVAEFKKAAETQPIGQIGAPFETTFGYHIMRVDKRDVQTLESMKEQLKSEAAQGLINDFMTKELPTLDYKVNLPTTSASPAASPEASPADASPAAQ